MTKLCAVGVPSVAVLCAIASCNRDPDACFDECSSFQTQQVCEAAGCGWNDVGFCAPIYRPNDPCFPTVQVDAGDDVDSTVPVDATTGSCNGAVTCTAPLPTCPSGDVPTIANGCWTGICEPIAACDAPPPCADIDDAVDCLARSDCSPTYSGTDCTGSDGSGCVSGGSGCTCTTYVFATCQGR